MTGDTGITWLGQGRFLDKASAAPGMGCLAPERAVAGRHPPTVFASRRGGHVVGSWSSSTLALTAETASWDREMQFNFSSRCSTCVDTVRGLMPSEAAI